MINWRFDNIAVLGAGAWGTALAQAGSRAGRKIFLWSRNSVVIDGIKKTGINQKYLPGSTLDNSIVSTISLQECISADLLLLVTPTQTLRSVCALAAGIIPEKVPVVICSKGIEIGTGLFVSDIVKQVMRNNPIGVLSGPSFAQDVVSGLPTAVTIAAHDGGLAEAIGDALRSSTFRLYHTDDVRGVEIGGAAKNVLAIACGIADGKKLGASAKAALVARGFAELRRFGVVYGASLETLMGLSGLGDLVLTCNSSQSRNFALGLALGQGMTLAEANLGKLAEGVFTARVLVDMAHRKGLDMPIAEAVTAILEGKQKVDQAVMGLMNRPQKHES